MRWLRIKVRARKPSTPWKSKMPPRSKITQLRQRKQRSKMFLPLNRARKKSLLLQSRLEAGIDRIRFLVRQGLSPTRFSALIAEHPVARRRGVHQALLPLFLSHRRYHTFSSPVPSVLARLLLEQDCGPIIPMSPFLFIYFFFIVSFWNKLA